MTVYFHKIETFYSHFIISSYVVLKSYRNTFSCNLIDFSIEIHDGKSWKKEGKDEVTNHEHIAGFNEAIYRLFFAYDGSRYQWL